MTVSVSAAAEPLEVRSLAMGTSGDRVIRLLNDSSLRIAADPDQGVTLKLGSLGESSTAAELISEVVRAHLRSAPIEEEQVDAPDDLLYRMGATRSPRTSDSLGGAYVRPDPELAVAQALSAFDARLVKLIVNGSVIEHRDEVLHVDDAQVAFVRLVGLSGRRS